MDDKALFDRIAASVARQSAMTTIGARLVEAGRGTVTIEVPHADHILQQNSFVHGGVIGMIADSACGYAALTMQDERHTVLTTEYKVHFLAPAVGESFVAIGKTIRAGRKLSVTQADVYAVSGDKRKHIAIMLATIMAVEKTGDLVD